MIGEVESKLVVGQMRLEEEVKKFDGGLGMH